VSFVIFCLFFEVFVPSADVAKGGDGRLVRHSDGMWDGGGSLLSAAIPSSSPETGQSLRLYRGLQSRRSLAKKHHLTISDFRGKMRSREG
jgi:hypothetical protein